MREKLLALVALQTVDLEVAALKKNAEAFPRDIAELEKQLGQGKAAADAERAKLDDLEHQRTQLEQTITDDKEKVRKWEARLAEQRTTREYSALAREIDIAKKGQTTMAEEAVELGRQSALQREVAKAKAVEFQGKAAELNERIAALKAKLAEAEAGVKGLEGRRGEAAAKVQAIDGSLLKRYENIRRKRLPAMVAVVAPGTCQGCRVNVRPQMYNTLVVTRGVDTCPSCSRIIHAAEALEPAPSP